MSAENQEQVLKNLEQTKSCWQEKKSFFERKLVITDSPGKEFELKQEIQRCDEEIKIITKEIESFMVIGGHREPCIPHRYNLLRETGKLIGRKRELNLLKDWVTNSDVESYSKAIFCIVALGGIGKSALTWTWFNNYAPQQIASLAGRFWWSFYENSYYTNSQK